MLRSLSVGAGWHTRAPSYKQRKLVEVYVSILIFITWRVASHGVGYMLMNVISRRS